MVHDKNNFLNLALSLRLHLAGRSGVGKVVVCVRGTASLRGIFVMR